MPTRISNPAPAGLVWSPVVDVIRAVARGAGGLRLVVSPFVTREGIEELVRGAAAPDLNVVCRWSARDLASGIADLSVYPFLRDRGAKLYLNPAIHLKLYVFGNGTVFHSSANATAKGLGIGPNGNVEVGAVTRLSSVDWDRLFELFEGSTLVNESVHDEVMQYQKAHVVHGLNTLPPLSLPAVVASAFSVSSLPVSPNPETFVEWHVNPERVPSSEIAIYSHDRFLFRVPPTRDRRACVQHLRREFRNSPFVKAIVELIRGSGAAPFGRVKEWIQATCSDRPAPYRWELTRNTQVLYEWLAYFFDEISWDQPNISQVIRWKTGGTTSAVPRRRNGSPGTRREARARYRRR